MERKYLYLIQLLFGLIWFKSAISKFIDPAFINTLPKTLAFFASKNPISWYKEFLVTIAIPNTKLFGELTRWGEITAAVLLSLTAIAALRGITLPHFHKLAALGALIGAWLNLQFGLASYWTSPANETLNLLMFATQVIFILYQRELAMAKITKKK